MSFLLLYKADSQLFDLFEVERVVRSDSHFQDLRFDTPLGDLIECEYVESDSRTIVTLSNDRQALYLSSDGTASLHALLLFQKALDVPMRLINENYTFDLTFSDIASAEELEAAMEKARTC